MPRARIEEYATRLDLDLGRKIKSLSKGNRQKIGVVQAFMHAPELLVLDEPTSGLGPFLQQQVVAMVRDARTAGQTVFMSSHVMGEVQQTADRVGIIREGRLIAVERVEDLRERAVRRVEIQFEVPVTAQEFGALPGRERRGGRPFRHDPALPARRPCRRADQGGRRAYRGQLPVRGARPGGAVLPR